MRAGLWADRMYEPLHKTPKGSLWDAPNILREGRATCSVLAVLVLVTVNSHGPRMTAAVMDWYG